MVLQTKLLFTVIIVFQFKKSHTTDCKLVLKKCVYYIIYNIPHHHKQDYLDFDFVSLKALFFPLLLSHTS